MKSRFWCNICVCLGQHLFCCGTATFKRLSNWSELSIPCYQSCEQFTDLSHQTLKACLITVTDRLGTNIVYLEKLPPFSENLDREIGLFKPFQGVIKIPCLNWKIFSDSSCNRPIKENSIAELLLIIMKNRAMIRVSCAITPPSYRQALVGKYCQQIFQGKCRR